MVEVFHEIYVMNIYQTAFETTGKVEWYRELLKLRTTKGEVLPYWSQISHM